MSGPAIGTSFHPETDPAFNGRRRFNGPPVQLARLPRRRRPGMIALAVALVGVGILAGAAVYTATNHRVAVLVATANVPTGSVITAGDIGSASVSAGPGVQVIPASQAQQVIGQIAGTTLHPGMLLTAAELTTLRPPGPGQVLVPLPMRPSVLPASGLTPGDHVLVVPTPGSQGQSGSSATAPSLPAPVPGLVVAVSVSPNPDGYQVVDVLVSASAGASVAAQASTGQVALIVTRRSA
jgi:SAF domain-containing protein